MVHAIKLVISHSSKWLLVQEFFVASPAKQTRLLSSMEHVRLIAPNPINIEGNGIVITAIILVFMGGSYIGMVLACQNVLTHFLQYIEASNFTVNIQQL
jgi:hypothetical protein